MSPVLTIAKRTYNDIDTAARLAAETQCNSPIHKPQAYFTKPGTVLLAGKPAHITYQYDALGRSTSYAQLDSQRGLARRIFDKFRGIGFDGRKRLCAAELKTFLRIEADFDKERSRHVALILASRGTSAARAPGQSPHTGQPANPAEPQPGPSHGAWRSPVTLLEPTAHTVLRTYAAGAESWPRALKLLESPRIANAAWKDTVTLRKLLEGCTSMKQVNDLAATYPFFEQPAGDSAEPGEASDQTAERAYQLRTQAGIQTLLNERVLARTVEKRAVEALNACPNAQESLKALEALGIDGPLLGDMLRGPLQTVRMPALLAALFEKVTNLDEAFQVATALPWNYNWSLSRLLKQPGVADKLAVACHQAFVNNSWGDFTTQLQRFFTGLQHPQDDSPMNRDARRIVWANEDLRSSLTERIKQDRTAPEWLVRSHTNANEREALSEI